MTIKIAINGLGRIGRCTARALIESGRNDLEIVAVNGPAPTDTHVHLLKYDSTHGFFPHIEKTGDDEIKLGNFVIPVFHERDPSKLPWKELGVDVVLECTGHFNDRTAASAHLTAGARKVVISAPAKEVDKTIVYGVNHECLTASDDIISIGSCTTNCLAPIVKVINDNIGIVRGFMTTVHAFTSDQNILDGTHKDLRRARTASSSMIPTSTGAAKALSLVIPEMEGKLDGVAIRVPTPNVSMIDLTFTTPKPVTADEINSSVKQAADSSMKGIIGYSDEPLVSIDYNHNPNSSIFDATGTKVVDSDFCRIASWYDNEWGFSNRMLDLTKLIASL